MYRTTHKQQIPCLLRTNNNLKHTLSTCIDPLTAKWQLEHTWLHGLINLCSLAYNRYHRCNANRWGAIVYSSDQVFSAGIDKHMSKEISKTKCHHNPGTMHGKSMQTDKGWGDMYNFTLLLAQMEQTPGLDPSTLMLCNIHFADTLTCMRQASKMINFNKILWIQSLV